MTVAIRTIRRAIEKGKQGILEVGKFIHANPELGFKEFKACARITDYVRELGYDVEVPFAGLKTAFRATMHGRRRGPTIGVIAEYDALEGLGHGCGHNLITVTAITAACAMAIAWWVLSCANRPWRPKLRRPGRPVAQRSRASNGAR